MDCASEALLPSNVTGSNRLSIRNILLIASSLSYMTSLAFSHNQGLKGTISQGGTGLAGLPHRHFHLLQQGLGAFEVLC